MFQGPIIFEKAIYSFNFTGAPLKRIAKKGMILLGSVPGELTQRY